MQSLNVELEASISISPNRTYILYVNKNGVLKGIGNNELSQLGVSKEIG
ncbi:MAG: hypothetical protein ACI8Q1_002472 [Parvicella sp.]